LVKEDNEDDLPNFLFNNYGYGNFDKEEIENITNLLTTENALICLSSKELEADCTDTEYFYNQKYNVSDLAPEVVEAFTNPKLDWKTSNASIALPIKNSLIPTNFEIIPNPNPNSTVQKIDTRPDSEVFHHQDSTFKLPKTCVGLQIYAGDDFFKFYDTKTYCLKQMFSKCFNNYIRGFNYSAKLAKCSFNIRHFQKYFQLKGKCYSQSLGPYLERFCELLANYVGFGALANLPTSEERYNDIRLQLIKSKKNELKAPPYRKTLNELPNIMTNKSQDTEEMIEILESLSYKEFVNYVRTELFSKIRFEWLFEGNITSEQAKYFALSFEHQFLRNSGARGATLAKSGVNSIRPVSLSSGHRGIIEKDIKVAEEKNGCFMRVHELGLAYGGKDKSGGNGVFSKCLWLTTWLYDEYFEELRSNQQLGYVVFCSKRFYNGVYYLFFCVQSNVQSTDHCRQKTEEFLVEWRKKLEEMSEEDFDKIRKGCIAKVTKKFENLYAKFSFDMEEVTAHQYAFDRKAIREAELGTLTKAGMLEYWDDIFVNNVKQLEFHQYSPSGKEEGEKERAERVSNDEGFVFYENESAFLARQSLYPDLTAIIP
jgi:insulysin